MSYTTEVLLKLDSNFNKQLREQEAAINEGGFPYEAYIVNKLTMTNVLLVNLALELKELRADLKSLIKGF